MPRLVLSADAVDDFERVQIFLAQKSLAASERAKVVIVQHLEKLRQQPMIYKPVDGQSEQREVVIAFGTYGYVLRYRYVEADDCVVMLRLWHQKEDRV